MSYTLRQARRLADKTQSETAKFLNVCRNTYNKIEQHPSKATIEQAKKLSTFFGLPYDEIFFGDESN